MIGFGFVQSWKPLIGLRIILGILEVCFPKNRLSTSMCANRSGCVGRLLSWRRVPPLYVVHKVRGRQALRSVLPHRLCRSSLWRNPRIRLDADGGRGWLRRLAVDFHH